ncbi:kinesin light chain [Ceratobasidium sp. AG-Ba]|nr:kinesin light chain [Ceratobasidium sp. AG-Ba]
MKQVQAEEKLSYTPLVKDYFDIVAGSGTGAVAVTLTGRLGMPTEQAIECFTKLSSEVFSDRNLTGTPAFKASKMDTALKNIVLEQTGNENELMRDQHDSSETCKTMVFAMSAHNTRGGLPAVFRSYHASGDTCPNGSIWQVLRAATAHPDMFGSMVMENIKGVREHFVDAAMGCGNPIEHVLKEVKRIYPNQRIACVVSIGGGNPCTIPIPEPTAFNRIFPTNFINAMRAIASDNERAAETMAERFQEMPNVYFRLNVDQGMQSLQFEDWDRLGEIQAHTRAYLNRYSTSELMNRAAKSIKERSGAVYTRLIDGAIQPNGVSRMQCLKECPAPTPVYTERQKLIEKAIKCLTATAPNRRVFVFHGLGGAGKTQLALQLVKRMREHWSEIIYINASSTEAMSSTLKEVAVSRGIGDSHADTIRWLGKGNKSWLLIFDNADDPSLNLHRYFPAGANGRILITTRSRTVAFLAQGPEPECHVSKMESQEALELLLKVSKRNEQLSREESDAGISLVEDLGCLALAIVQAGAYIWSTSCSFIHYLDIYSRQPREVLEKHGNVLLHITGYEKTVSTTWEMNYKRLSKRAQGMLWLLAYLKPDGISQEIFRRAASHIDRKPVLPLNTVNARALDRVKSYLRPFLTANKEWKCNLFTDVMTEIMSYSLISYDRVNMTFELHVLVQNWIRGVVPKSHGSALACSAFLITLSIYNQTMTADYAYYRLLEPHVDKILTYGTRLSSESKKWFAFVLEENGRYDEAAMLGEQVLGTSIRLLGREHFETLTLMHNLALTYSKQGLYGQAEKLQVEVLEIKKRLLGEEHCDTLIATSNLALTYSHKGLYTKVEALQVKVLEASKEILGEDHIDTLIAMNNLASTYSDQGQHYRAETLQHQVLETIEHLLGHEHPNTLTAMSNLASTYSDQGRLIKAETLQIQILEATKRMFGESHPDALAAMHSLALTYSEQKLYKQAEVLQVQVLEGSAQQLGDEHPCTLTAMSNLASTYSNQGHHKQAEELQLLVLETSRRLVGEEHPDTLIAMNNLASTYHDQGLYMQAEALFQLTVQLRKKVLGIQHPFTITSMRWLSNVYRRLGSVRQQEYEALKAGLAQLEFLEDG